MLDTNWETVLSIDGAYLTAICSLWRDNGIQKRYDLTKGTNARQYAE